MEGDEPTIEDTMKDAGFDLDNPENNQLFGGDNDSQQGEDSGGKDAAGDEFKLPKSRFFNVEDDEEDDGDESGNDGDDGADDLNAEDKKLLEGVSEENRVNIRNIRTELKQAKAELEKLRSQPAGGEEVNNLRQQVKDLSDRLRVVDLQNHPDYQEQFVKPSEAIRSEIAEILQAQEIEGVNVNDIISKNGIEFAKALSAASEDMTGYFQRRFEAAVEKLHGIEQQRKSALETSGKVLEGLNQKSAQERQQIFDSTYSKVIGPAEGLLQPKEVDPSAPEDERAAIEAYNADLAALKENAMKLATQPASAEHVATSAVKAQLFDLMGKHVMPQVQKEFTELVKLNRQLVSRLKSAQGLKRAPAPGSTRRDKGGVDETSDEFLKNLFPKQKI